MDVIAPAVPAEDRLLLGLGRSGGPTDPRCRAPDSSAPDVRAPGRIEARRSRRSPNRIKRLRHSSRIARTKAPRGRWHSARGRATRRGRGPCLARSAEHSHDVVSPTGTAPLGCSYPSASGYEQHEVGTRVDEAHRASGALGNYSPELTSPSTRSPNQRSRAFEVARVSIRPGVLQEYRVLGPILGTFRNVTRPCQTSVHETRFPGGLVSGRFYRISGSGRPQAGGGQGARAARSRQEHGVDVSSDSSEPPTGSLHRLQGEPRPRTAHLAPEAGSG